MPVPLMITGGMALTSLAMATSIALQNYISQNKNLVTTKKDKDKKQIEPPKEPDEEPNLGTIAEVLAEEIIKDKYKTYEESYPTLQEQTERALKKIPEDYEERAKFFEENVGYVQRGNPETAMINATMFHSGTLSPALEHIGDLTHRLTENPEFRYSTVLEKIEKMIKNLDRSREIWGTDMMSFIDEHEQNIKNNIKYRNVPEKEYRTTLNNLLSNYVTEHKKIPTYNEIQENAKQAAIAIGELDVDKSLNHLRFIQNELNKGQESFTKKTQEY